MKETRLISRFFFFFKSDIGKWAILGPKIAHRHNSGSTVRFFLILHNEKGQQVDESNKNVLYHKNLFMTKGPF